MPIELEPGRRLAVLAPVVELAAGDVVLGAVRVDHEDDPDLAAVDDVRDPRVGPVAVDEPVEDVRVISAPMCSSAWVPPSNRTSGSASSTADVVGDLGRPDVAALVALADREALDDVGVGGRHGGDVGGHLRVAVVAGPGRPGIRSPRRSTRSRRGSAAARTGRRRVIGAGWCVHRHSMRPSRRSPSAGRASDRAPDVPVGPGPLRFGDDRSSGSVLARRSTTGAPTTRRRRSSGRTGSWRAAATRPARFRWASVTKLVTALAVLIAAERGLLDLDEPAGPPGSTVRHLLAHASGLPFEGGAVLAAPGTRRIYSNPGYDATRRTRRASGRGGHSRRSLREWVLAPLGMDETRAPRAAVAGAPGPVGDLGARRGAACGRRWSRRRRPGWRRPSHSRAAGVVPGVGRFDRATGGSASSCTTARRRTGWAPNSPATFGHIGGAGTFLWVDPVADVGLVTLTDRDFGPWALEVWPSFSAAVLAAARSAVAR